MSVMNLHLTYVHIQRVPENLREGISSPRYVELADVVQYLPELSPIRLQQSMAGNLSQYIQYIHPSTSDYSL